MDADLVWLFNKKNPVSEFRPLFFTRRLPFPELEWETTRAKRKSHESAGFFFVFWFWGQSGQGARLERVEKRGNFVLKNK